MEHLNAPASLALLDPCSSPFLFLVTPRCVRGLLLPGSAIGHHSSSECWGVKTGPAVCKASSPLLYYGAAPTSNCLLQSSDGPWFLNFLQPSFSFLGLTGAFYYPRPHQQCSGLAPCSGFGGSPVAAQETGAANCQTGAGHVQGLCLCPCAGSLAPILVLYTRYPCLRNPLVRVSS